MTNCLSFRRLLQRSLRHRSRRSLSALLALTVSATAATALLTLYADLNEKLHHEFRSFGANIVIRAKAEPSEAAAATTSLPTDAVGRARVAAGRDSIVVPEAFAIASTDRGTPVIVVGTDFARVRQLNHWWKVDSWPVAENDALLGGRAAGFVADEPAIRLRFAGKPAVFHGAGKLRTGGDEDSRIYIPLSAFAAWTGLAPTVLEIQAPGRAEAVDSALSRLREAFPGSTVEPVRQLVEGENRIVDRTHALMFGAVLLIALTVAVSVLATLSASVLERRRDFALMKALGSSQRHLLWFFLAEALLLALVGVACGWILGSICAWTISEANFHTASLPRWGVLPVVLLMNLVIAALAAVGPSRVLRSLEPAALLKGE